jgi:hypothetical protein
MALAAEDFGSVPGKGMAPPEAGFTGAAASGMALGPDDFSRPSGRGMALSPEDFGALPGKGMAPVEAAFTGMAGSGNALGAEDFSRVSGSGMALSAEDLGAPPGKGIAPADEGFTGRPGSGIALGTEDLSRLSGRGMALSAEPFGALPGNGMAAAGMRIALAAEEKSVLAGGGVVSCPTPGSGIAPDAPSVALSVAATSPAECSAALIGKSDLHFAHLSLAPPGGTRLSSMLYFVWQNGQVTRMSLLGASSARSAPDVSKRIHLDEGTITRATRERRSGAPAAFFFDALGAPW